MVTGEEELDDRVLVERARCSDREAFSCLVRRHEPAALTLCRRLLGDGEASQDAVQDATLSAWLDLDRLLHPDRFGSWLCGIALNNARRALRTSMAEARLVARLVGETRTGGGPEDHAEQVEIRDRVRLAVAGLPPGQRDAVYLFYLSGLTHREAAAELGVSVNAVKARLHQGRVGLGRALVDLRTREVPMPRSTDLVPMRIVDVRSSGPEVGDAVGVVLLEASDRPGHLPIFIGLPEAVSLAFSLENVEMPRPMTYQLASSLLDA